MAKDIFVMLTDIPAGTPSLEITKTPVAVNEFAEFRCEPGSDAGLPPADHFLYYEDPDEPAIHNGSSTWTSSFQVVKDDAAFYCSVGNYVGTGSEQGSETLTVQGENKHLVKICFCVKVNGNSQ